MSEFADYVTVVESPDGRDNDRGSGAFGRFQFMPATAAAYAKRLPWGAGVTPENAKTVVMADPAREKQLYDLYEADSRAALGKAGLPVNRGSVLAMHRFGQAGGQSVLQAPANMPLGDWVNSVQWGNGVSPNAVIKQNSLERYGTVGDLRRGFLGINEPTPEPQVAAAPAPVVAPPQPTGPQPLDPATAMSLAGMFDIPQPQQRKKPRSMIG